MKTTLFLNDEKVQTRLLLRNAAPAKVREPEAVAGCNCDRWGHPCPGCTDHKQGQRATVQDLATKK